MEIEEIRKRIYNPNKSPLFYDGLDMSGDNDTQERCRLDNFNFIKEKFGDVLWDLDFEDFKLHCWEGLIWWGEKTDYNCDWSGESSEKILEFIINEKPYPKQEIFRIISRENRFNVLKRQKWRCNTCGEILKFNKQSKWEGKIAHIDHIHPFSKKETYPNGAWNINEICNLQALCPECNLIKTNKEIQ